MTGAALVRMTDWKQPRIVEAEAGRRPIPPRVTALLDELETSAAILRATAVQVATQVWQEASTPPILLTYRSDTDLWADQPEMDGVPAAVHRVAMAHARADLAAADIPASVHYKPTT